MPVELPVNSKRNAVTLFCAIGNCLNQPCFRLAKSTNKVAFKLFIKQLSGSLKSPVGGKPYLVLDNATAHKSRTSRALLERHFHVLF